MANANLVQFHDVEAAGGFDLFIPPTPIPKQGNPPRFLMLDDRNHAFYNVLYDHPLVRNGRSWASLNMHRIQDPAIIMEPLQLERLRTGPERLRELGLHHALAFGSLVSVVSRTEERFVAELLGGIAIQPLHEKDINWALLEIIKEDELIVELRNGILRRAWNRRPAEINEAITFSTRASTLNDMTRQWHDDSNGALLSHELDEIWMGARPIKDDQTWRLVPQGSQRLSSSGR